jgi:hypothetical protein
MIRTQQQIIGVNQRLGNSAVQNMQGTTRCIFDTANATVSTDQTYTFFSGVTSRLYPLSNLNNNRFEVGESLAIQGISAFRYATATTPTANTSLSALTQPTTGILNFYIGNQRVLKDLEFVNFSYNGLGKSMATTQAGASIYLETPIVIPPQIEFYATLRVCVGTALVTTDRIVLSIFGAGTLLNTKESF